LKSISGRPACGGEPRRYHGLEAKLKDIIDALDVQFDESTYFVNLDTGEVELVHHRARPTTNGDWSVAQGLRPTKFHEKPMPKLGYACQPAEGRGFSTQTHRS
jgi:hypothetical protein